MVIHVLNNEKLSVQREGHVFRPEVQGLRGVAVILVVVYHLWPTRLPGGYVGVDVFFVLSGFLISSHILKELNTGQFSVKLFYARRSARLLPAAYTVLVVVAIVNIGLLPLTLWSAVGEQLIASSLYVENWILAANSVDYLAIAQSLSPIQHFWSLSVEEQFYLLWPFVLMAAFRLQRRKRKLHLPFLATIVALSFSYCIYLTATSPTAYFSTFARIWELGVGALCAYTFATPLMKARLGWLSWIAFLGLVTCSVVFNSSTQFPGVAATAPVLATAVILTFTQSSQRGNLARMLSLRPLQFLGDISYSLYLWHWPIISLLPGIVFGVAFGARVTFTQRVILLIVSLVVAVLSKQYIEDRFRYGTTRSTRVTSRVALIGVAALSAAALTLSLIALQVSSARIDVARVQLRTFLSSGQACAPGDSSDGCWRLPARSVMPDPIIAASDVPFQKCQQSLGRTSLLSCGFGVDSGKFRVALVGDSHANQWASSLNEIAIRENWTVSTFLKSGCSFTVADRSDPSCETWNRALLSQLQKAKYDLVIASGIGLLSPTDEEKNAQVAGLVSVWRELQRGGTPVVVIADTPWPSAGGVLDPAACVLRQPQKCAFSRSGLRVFDPQISAAAKANVAIVDLNALICPHAKCEPIDNGLLVFRDATHLTDIFARSLWQSLDAGLRRGFSSSSHQRL